MRGKVFGVHGIISDTGITPAYAGKSFVSAVVICGVRDHPRLCGEKRCRQALRCSSAGSPPPMRGKGDIEEKWVMANRITPAYAGKRQLSTLYSRDSEDHPRLCGEKPLH